MEGMPIRIAGLGRIGGGDVASTVAEEAIRIGAEVDFIIESDQYDEFDQGLIDWRTVPVSYTHLTMPTIYSV